MRTPLSNEQRQALVRQPEGIEVHDYETQKVYFLADAALHQQAMEALHKQQEYNAIQRGIDDLEAGRVTPLDEADQQMRDELGFPPGR